MASTDVKSVFDGWGYIRLFKTQIPGRGGAGSIRQIDTYAIPESQNPAFANGYGDLSVHEVAVDPHRRRLRVTMSWWRRASNSLPPPRRY